MSLILLAYDLEVAETRFIDALQLSAVGIAVVFAALVAMQGLLVLLRRFSLTPAPVAEKTPTIQSPATQPTGIPPEIVAVISAAVVASLGTGARVTRIRIAAPSAGSAWSETGRREVQTSHHPRRRDS